MHESDDIRVKLYLLSQVYTPTNAQYEKGKFSMQSKKVLERAKT